MPGEDRYARQRLLPWWDQDRLRSARVLVAGAGALGNELLKNLALLGVGRLVVFDFDRVERSNLSRCVLFGEADVGRPKAKAAAEAVRRLNDEVEVEGLHGDLHFDVGLGWYRHSDLAVGCLDNLAARARAGADGGLAGIPYLDGALWALGGEVRWFPAAGGPCFECTLGPDDRPLAGVRYSCSGFRDTAAEEADAVPTLACTASLVGGLLAQEAVKWLCGQPTAMGRAVVYNGLGLTLHRSRLAVDPACPSRHRPYEKVVELPHQAAGLTARQLLAIAAANRGPESDMVLQLGRDFLIALTCPRCGHQRAVDRPLGQVPESERFCERDGTACEATVIHSIEASSPHADRPLAALGVPPGEVLAVQAGVEVLLYELTGDLPPA
jgi:adenylyltransferase/sulfurtransferase